MLILRKKDTYPQGKATLEEETSPNVFAAIDLKTAVSVKANIKPAGGGSTKERECKAGGSASGEEIKKATGANAGKVEWYWQATDLEPSATEIYHVEFEIEWAESGGVKRYQTVSNAGYYEIEALVGNGEPVGATLVIKALDTFPSLKATLERNGAPINLKTGGPGGGEVETVKITIVPVAGGSAIVSAGTCTGASAGSIKSVTNGVVEYTWAQGDLKPAGEYAVYLVIKWKKSSTGRPGEEENLQTEPVQGYFPLTIVQELGAT